MHYQPQTQKFNRAASVFLAAALVAVATNGYAAGGRNGGGTPGDTFVYHIVYTPETCPLPPTVKADYSSILFCGLGKRSNKPADFI